MTRVVLLASFFFFIPLIAFGAVEISDGSIQALYHLEDEVDSSGNGFNLTNTGTVTFPTGFLNNGAITSSSKYLSISNDFSINGATTTIGGWRRLDSAPASNQQINLFALNDTTTDTTIDINYFNDAGTNKIRFRRRRIGSADDAITVATTLTTGTWYHFLLSYDGATLEGFLNNVSQGTQSSSGNGSFAVSADAFVINANINESGTVERYWSGIADEVFIADTILSSDIRSAIYNSGTGDEICTTVGCGDEEEPPTYSSSTLTDSNKEFAFLWIVLIVFVGTGYGIFRIINR